MRVRVPASTANLGPGFDSLGMALNLYAGIEMSEAHDGVTRVELIGDNLNGLPTDKSNLLYEVAQMVFDKAGVSMPELHIAYCSDIPLTRGLGSSASAIVGSLVAANALIGSPLSQYELFQMASALEQHPDNVGASLFGGLIAAFWDGERAEHIRIEPHERLEVLVTIPEFQLATEKARHVLPKQLPMKDAVYNIGHSSVLVAAFCTGNLGMIRHAMKDALHQPYRAELVPGLAAILRDAADHGALGAALSGAGPTVLALVDAASANKPSLQAFLLETLSKEGISASALWLKPSLSGAEVLAPNEPASLLEAVRAHRNEVRA